MKKNRAKETTAEIPQQIRSGTLTQVLADHIDQLDLALDQLAVADRNFDRFALMLVDNVVELTLHQFAKDKLYENDVGKPFGQLRYEPKSVEAALGQHFDAKVRFATKCGLIDRPMCESLIYLHSFRNTAHHKGLRHEGILHSLAIFYFRNACELLAAYKPYGWSWSGADRISYRARKYLGKLRNIFDDPVETFRGAYSRLGEVASSMTEDLVGDLVADMQFTIYRTDEAIRFMAEAVRKKRTRDQVVVDCQARAFSSTDAAKTFARANGWSGRHGEAFVHWLAEHYDWPIKSDPIRSWRSRLGALSRDNDYHRALKRYCDFMRQTEVFRSQLSDASAELDAYIQHQVDVARGK